jgi:hypothetical protein
MIDIQDKLRAEDTWKRGDISTALGIMERNPNVGLEVRSFRTNSTVTFSIWGKDAANFLLSLGKDIAKGKLIAVTPNEAMAYLRGMNGQEDIGDGSETAHSKKIRPDLPKWVHDFYKAYQGRIDRCINFVFGQRANGQPDDAAKIMPRQTIRNAPALNIELDQFQLQPYTGNDHTQGTFTLEGPYGTVYIAKNLYNKISLDELRRTFFHELGNILSKSLTGDAKAYGDPNGLMIGGKPDYDTGARLEKCIFKTLPK